MTSSTTRLINAIAESRNQHSRRGSERLVRSLNALSKANIDDPEELVRLHEALLFLRAYPPSVQVLKQVEETLNLFQQRISRLQDNDIDLSALDDPEVSGIAGTSVTSNFSYAIVRWLSRKYPKQLSIDWDWFENEDTFGATMPRFLPLLDEDAMVEAHVPYREWLRRAAGRQNEVAWLIDQFKTLKVSDKDRARMYDSLKLHIRWQFGVSVSRTGMKLPRRRIFFHRTPLLQRRDISLQTELAAPQIEVEKLSPQAGERIIDLARATSAVRYRELHGFTYGDSQNVLKANPGRGTEVYVTSVRPPHRLPLRAYHAALIFKNGVPVAYFEGLSFFERMESGFNLYYTFREGETAWLFARILRLMRQLLGVTVISIDPYQVGHENEEGIESGAFWFYRKLGFRPVRTKLMELTLAEEKKIRAKRGYRTPARTLRKLAAGHMLLDTVRNSSDWDKFEMRNIGFAVQNHMSRAFAGDAARFHAATLKFLEKTFGKQINIQPHLMESFACMLMLIPDLAEWTHEEKSLLARIIEAKARKSESLYLKLMQRHKRLRAAIIQLGS